MCRGKKEQWPIIHKWRRISKWIANNRDRRLICEINKPVLRQGQERQRTTWASSTKKKAWADGVKNVTSLHLCQMKNGTFARFARAFSFFVHLAAVLVFSTTWNDNFCSRVDDVIAWLLILNFFFNPQTADFSLIPGMWANIFQAQ